MISRICPAIAPGAGVRFAGSSTAGFQAIPWQRSGVGRATNLGSDDPCSHRSGQGGPPHPTLHLTPVGTTTLGLGKDRNNHASSFRRDSPPLTYRNVVAAWANGAHPVNLTENRRQVIASVEKTTRSRAWYNNDRAVVLAIQRSSRSNQNTTNRVRFGYPGPVFGSMRGVACFRHSRAQIPPSIRMEAPCRNRSAVYSVSRRRRCRKDAGPPLSCW